MEKSHIDAWSDYLAAELHQQYGMTEQQAKETVVQWLKSLDRELPVQRRLARQAFSTD